MVWRRGKLDDESPKYDINFLDHEADCDFTFSKCSWFYQKSSGKNYEPKFCDFIIKLYSKNTVEDIALIKDYNMAPMVNKSQKFEKIEFVTSTVLGTFIEVEWTIEPTNERKS